MLGVVRLGQLARDRPQLGRHQPEVLPLQATDDFSDEPAFDAVGLHNDKGAIHERRTVAVAPGGQASLRPETPPRAVVAPSSHTLR
jgi:hypothetical protein